MVCELSGAEVMASVGESSMVYASASEVTTVEAAFSAACTGNLDGADWLAAESNDILSVREGCENEGICLPGVTERAIDENFVLDR